MTSSSPQRDTISAFIICLNEERQIRRCLESVTWCDEIIVVDSGSTDKTLEIAREFTSKVYHHAWPGFVKQKALGLSYCSGTWVLNIDADEVVTPELQDELLAIATTKTPHNGFKLLRTVFFLGKFWRKGGWYPEYRVRFVRKSATTWGGEDPHEKALVQGSLGKLSGELLHYTYDSITTQIRSLNSLSSVGAQSLYNKGHRGSLFKLTSRPIARFLKFYFIKKGFLEGSRGFVVALIDAVGVFLKYAKLWELSYMNKKTSEK
jgi:glycosyltransferase involved in cell wall biosynthesis